MENSPHLWGAGPWGSHAKEEQGNPRDSVQQLLDQAPHQRGGTPVFYPSICLLFSQEKLFGYVCGTRLPGAQPVTALSKPLLSCAQECWTHTQARMPCRRGAVKLLSHTSC